MKNIAHTLDICLLFIFLSSCQSDNLSMSVTPQPDENIDLEIDQFLGEIELPYNQFYDVRVSDQQLDNSIVYQFTTTEQTGYHITLDQNNFEMKLMDASGNVLGEGYEIYGTQLQAGDYYLSLFSPYVIKDIDDSVSFTFRGALDTDVDLGLLSLPYERPYDIAVLINEPDQEVNYRFEIKQDAVLSIATFLEVDMSLFKDGQQLANYDTLVSSEVSLSKGTYALKIKNTRPQSTISGTMHFNIRK